MQHWNSSLKMCNVHVAIAHRHLARSASVFFPVFQPDLYFNWKTVARNLSTAFTVNLSLKHKGVFMFLCFLKIFFAHFLSSTTFLRDGGKRKPPPKDQARFVGHYVKLPKEFRGKDWASKTYGPGYAKKFDVVKLTSFKKGSRGHDPAYLFTLGNEHDYHLPLKEVIAFDELGLVSGLVLRLAQSGARKIVNFVFFGRGKS